MNTISLCMIVKNEEKVIARCLESVHGLVDEIIIVDTGSTDNTIKIAEQFNVKLYDYKWNDSFSDARNYSLEKATSKWILVLDADEYIVDTLKADILDFINGNTAIGKIEILNKYLHNEEIKYLKSFVSRLFPNGVKYEGKIHEQLSTNLPRRNVAVYVEHDGYYLTDKSDRNIKLLEEELKTKPKDTYYLYQLAKEYKELKNFTRSNQLFRDSYGLMNGNETFYPNVVVDYLYSLKESGKSEEGFRILVENKDKLLDFPDYCFISGLLYMDLIFSDINRYIHLLPEIERSFLYCIKLGETTKYNSVIGTGSYIALYNLGVYYETTGHVEKAIECYELSAQYDYVTAKKRLKALGHY